MKVTGWFQGIVVTMAFLSTCANAGLIDRGNGMIYDDLHDITWIGNANLAESLGTGNGKLSWNDTLDWVSALDYGGFQDWRLPTFDYNDPYCTIYSNGEGQTCSSSEMGHLYFDFGFNRVSGGFNWHTAGFINSTSSSQEYWYGNTNPAGEGGYVFQFWNGLQIKESINPSNTKPVLVLRDGDVTQVPEPSTIAIFSLALFGLLVRKRAIIKNDI